MGNCHPLKTNVNLDFASVEIGFLRVTISHVTLSCGCMRYHPRPFLHSKRIFRNKSLRKMGDIIQLILLTIECSVWYINSTYQQTNVFTSQKEKL